MWPAVFLLNLGCCLGLSPPVTKGSLLEERIAHEISGGSYGMEDYYQARSDMLYLRFLWRNLWLGKWYEELQEMRRILAKHQGWGIVVEPTLTAFEAERTVERHKAIQRALRVVWHQVRMEGR